MQLGPLHAAKDFPAYLTWDALVAVLHDHVHLDVLEPQTANGASLVICRLFVDFLAVVYGGDSPVEDGLAGLDRAGKAVVRRDDAVLSMEMLGAVTEEREISITASGPPEGALGTAEGVLLDMQRDDGIVARVLGMLSPDLNDGCSRRFQ